MIALFRSIDGALARARPMLGLFARLEDAAAKALLAAVVFLVFAAGLARTFGHPLIWSVDFAQLLFVWLCFVGANKALRAKAHVGVDYFVRKLPAAGRRWIELALALVSLAFLVVMAWNGVKLTMLNVERVYGDSGISYAWVTGAVPVGCLLLAVTLADHLVGMLAGRSDLVFAAPADAADGSGPRIDLI